MEHPKTPSAVPNRQPRKPLPPKERVEVHLDEAGYLGNCVGRLDGLVVLASNGLPGEQVIVEVDERKSRYVQGRVVEVLEASPLRVAPPCPLFGSCGGCSWQHVTYADEIAIKQTIAAEQIRNIGGFAEAPLKPILEMTDPYRYRNQGRFSVRHGNLGFTRRHSKYVLTVNDCLLMQSPVVETLKTIQGRSPRLHQVVIRAGARSGEVLVAPRLSGIVDGIDNVPSGQEAYTENLLGLRFRVAANSFFQANTRPLRRPAPGCLWSKPALPSPADGLSQSDVLALLVLDRLALDGSESVLDAYCGVGTFALLAAKRARRVVGIEESRSAIADALLNRGDQANVEFHAGKVEEVLPKLDERFDAAVLDPSRVGCAPETLASLIELQPRKIVYVSCDPATLARDLRILCDAAYDLVEIQPVDMFPRTYHLECVATLVKR